MNVVTNTMFEQLTALVVKIKGMDRHVTEIIVLINKTYAHLAYLCNTYMSDSINSSR